MKKITSIILSIVMLASMAVLCIPASAEAKTSTANYYEWNFDSLSDGTVADNTVINADSGNNTLTVKKPSADNLVVAGNVKTKCSSNGTNLLSGAKVQTAKATSTSIGTVGDYSGLGKALYIADRYLEFGTEIHLDCTKPWKVELTGNLMRGGMTRTALGQYDYGVGDGAILANDETDDYLFIDGGDRAFWLYDNNNSFEVRTSNSTGWATTYRIGQNRDQRLIIENVYDEAKEIWCLKWTVAECYNSTGDAWNGVVCTFTNKDAGMVGRDFVFTGLGSEEHCITSNINGTWGYNPWFSSIKIWEDTSVTMEGFQTRTSTTAQSESADVRMLATVNGTGAYKTAGFVVSKSNSAPTLDAQNVTDYSTKTVYTSINVAGDEQAAVAGRYYVPLVINNIPNAKFNETIYVRAYLVTASGDIIYGNVCSFKVADLLD